MLRFLKNKGTTEPASVLNDEGKWGARLGTPVLSLAAAAVVVATAVIAAPQATAAAAAAEQQNQNDDPPAVITATIVTHKKTSKICLGGVATHSNVFRQAKNVQMRKICIGDGFPVPNA